MASKKGKTSAKARPKPKPKVSKAKPVKVKAKAKPAAKKSAPKPMAHKPTPRPPAVPAPKMEPVSAEPTEVVVPLPKNARLHVLSLSFLRDGDEFYARLETQTGEITELKNRSLDQLLTLVAGELEDLLG